MGKLELSEIDKVIGENLEPKTAEEVLVGQPKGFEQDGWYGRELSTDGTQMMDSATGKPMVLRVFEFKKDKRIQKELQAKGIAVNRQMLFTYHWPQIKATIWGDGLVENRDAEPRVIIGKGSYKIVILCEPIFRTIVADKPTTLQEVFKKKT